MIIGYVAAALGPLACASRSARPRHVAACLVGSEMCIRDRARGPSAAATYLGRALRLAQARGPSAAAT